MKKLVMIFTVLIFSTALLRAQTAVQPSGSGTAGDPYQVATLENLYWITQNQSSWSSYFEQVADIDASSSSSWDGGAGFTPIGNSYYFTGSYNGKNNTISGLFINRPNSSGIGLFNTGTNSKIENLHLEDVNITGMDIVGGLGNMYGGIASNVTISGNVTATGVSYAGGLAGISNGTVLKSFSSCNIKGTGGVSKAGGLLGYNGGTISQSYSTGNVTVVSDNGGGLVGLNSGTIENSYSNGDVNGLIHIGGLVGENQSIVKNSYSTGVATTSIPQGLIGYNTGTVTNSFWDTETSGALNSYGSTGKTTAEMKTQSTFIGAGWDFVGEITNGTEDIWGFNGSDNSGYPFLVWQNYPTPVQPEGTGTSEDPYLVATLNNLFWVTKNSSSWNKQFVQTTDIDASETQNWDSGSGLSPIGSSATYFNGKYNGKGHLISNLYINRPSSNYVGLFGAMNGIIDSLGLEKVKITGVNYVGGLVGLNFNGSVSNSYSTGSVAANSFGGGIAGTNYRLISNCYSSCSVTVSQNGGGLVGDNKSLINATITNSFSTGTIAGIYYLGGLVGSNQSIVSNSFWDTQASGTMSSSGGTGKTTVEMKTDTTFTNAGWDFTTVWSIDGTTNNGYPFLQWQTRLNPTTGNYQNISFNSPVTLTGGLNVNGTLTVSAQITTGSNTIDLGSTGSLTGETPGNYIQGTVQASRDLSSSQSNIAGLGISIDPQSNNLGNTVIKRQTGTAAQEQGIKQVWTITPQTQPSGPVSVTLSWPSTNDNSINLNDLVVYKSGDGGETWNVVSAVINKDSDPRTATFTITSFSVFTIGNSSFPLPVELSSFTASVSPEGVKLNWSTASETANSGWEIEVRKSEDRSQESEWEKVGFVAGNGTTTEARSYSFTTGKIKANLAEFRLKQIDADGTVSYSQVLTIELKPAEFALEQNYPNPFNPATTIRYSLAAESRVSLKVYNSVGQQVKTLVQASQPAGFYSVPLSASDLSSGVYFYILEAGSFKSVKKLTLLK